MKHLTAALLLLLAGPAWSACTGSNPTWASTPDLASVQTCVTNAASGSTINVSAGSATWSGAVTIPAAKDLSIIGAGIGNTNITMSGNCFIIGAGGGQSSASRISGFTFNNCVIQFYEIDPAKAFRVDHNSFAGTAVREMISSAGAGVSVAPKGLFDHNTFQNVRLLVNGTSYGWSDDGGAAQSAIWYSDPDLGGPQAVYIEDNTFNVTATPVPLDGNYAGRAVFRFNTVNFNSTYMLEWHGVQGDNRGPQRLEVYNNTLNSFNWTPLDWRGGTGMYFNNTTTGDPRGIVLETERACINESVSGICNGTSNWDGNRTGQSGYPCRDQIGRGKDKTLFSGSGALPEQELRPIYIFNNLYGATRVGVEEANSNCAVEGTNINVANRDYYVGLVAAQTSPTSPFNGTSGVGIGTLANRPTTCTPTPQAADAGFGGVGYWATDQGEWNSLNAGSDGQLYTCTATNTWTLYYRPYTYPHPLQTVRPNPVGGVIVTQLIGEH